MKTKNINGKDRIVVDLELAEEIILMLLEETDEKRLMLPQLIDDIVQMTRGTRPKIITLIFHEALSRLYHNGNIFVMQYSHEKTYIYLTEKGLQQAIATRRKNRNFLTKEDK